MSELWYTKASYVPGPFRKRVGPMIQKGVVCHSAEGYKAGLLYELKRSDRSVAWHFSVLANGDILQHYPINVSLRHSADWGEDNDGADGNGTLIGIEHEGVVGNPLSKSQRESSVALVRWLAIQGKYKLKRKITLWEHKELSDTGTSCPSNRIPWEYYFDVSPPLTSYQRTVMESSSLFAGLGRLRFTPKTDKEGYDATPFRGVDNTVA